ncbi:uncharacterized protein L969DRAFT_344979 [Mixia osmundae IAM 14324]|uniref:G-protein coupled receptors family 1 profile domain-containing protein n=1 Tax=Mixia osmundae (strain CBS 9802 / IAM 14324 / JCM 22182 / KY 12970) TaxID=764103 RepID=G7E5V0_MIXOS|nr:uncharacterized protein L969DRAFT_344979 [Mixia osmundae IAM 14324]KEI40638.1 hypothetical protein L969DRAFT_344979 [Mixia osmundae IAM 14324]GAA98210.1 hypothetical protein E5Q_04893 [Mixia osmundae IAM 14324]
MSEYARGAPPVGGSNVQLQPVEPFSLGLFLAPWLLGINIAWALNGAGLIVLCRYISHYKDDSRWIKLAVAVTSGTALLSILVDTHVGFQIFVSWFGDASALVDNRFVTVEMSFALVAIEAFTAQAYFAARVYRLTNRSKLVIFPIACLMLLGLATGILLTAIFASGSGTQVFFNQGNLRWALESHLFITASVDLCIAAAICARLWTVTSSESGARASVFVMRTIRLALLSSGISSLLAMATGVLFLTSDTTGLTFMASLICLTQVYNLNLLFALTSRSTQLTRPKTSDKPIFGYPVLQNEKQDFFNSQAIKDTEAAMSRPLPVRADQFDSWR